MFSKYSIFPNSQATPFVAVAAVVVVTLLHQCITYFVSHIQYRKPPPPKNRARQSRVPRALKTVEPNASPNVFQVGTHREADRERV